MTQNDKIEVEEEVICTCVLYLLRYGGEISMSSLRNFVTLMVLTGYLPECPIIGSQN